MSIFMCAKCHCVENTALSGHWWHIADGDGKEWTCSECDTSDPELGKWHGRFPKRKAYGYLVGNDGYLFTVQNWESGQIHHTKPKGIINDQGEIVLWQPAKDSHG